MRRVAIISGSYLPNIWNGLGRHTTSLAWGLSGADFDVTVFAPSRSNDSYLTQSGQITIAHVGFENSENIATIPILSIQTWNDAVFNIIGNLDFDYVLLTNCDSWPCAKKYIEKYPMTQVIGFVPFLYSTASWLTDIKLRNITTELEKDFLAKCAKLVAHSISLATSVATQARREVYVLPHTEMQSDNIKYYAPKKNTICYLGRLNKTKSVESLIRAMSLLPASYTLTIASPETAEVYVQRIKKLADTLKVRSRINFCGWLNTADARKLYKESSLAIASGMNEPYGYGAIDPMSLGTPVIVSEFSGLVDYMVDKSNVYVNVDTLVELISHKLSRPFMQAKDERLAGITHSSLSFSINAMTMTLEEIIRC